MHLRRVAGKAGGWGCGGHESAETSGGSFLQTTSRGRCRQVESCPRCPEVQGQGQEETDRRDAAGAGRLGGQEAAVEEPRCIVLGMTESRVWR